MCGTVNVASTLTCTCGYHFDDDPLERADFLRDRLNVGRTLQVTGIALVIGGVALLFLLPLGSIVAWAFSLALFKKGIAISNAARAGLEELAPLPQAKLRS
jgi:hypothetical protein